MNKIILLSLFGLLIAGCGKNPQPRLGCSTNGLCTFVFASVNIQFTDNANNPVNVQNFSAINQRTGLKLEATPGNSMPGTVGNYVIANDNMRDQLSDEGDDILVSGTYNGQTKTAVVKISGGCNCHVERKSGPQTITFD